jgi:polyisoprenoid-binding protein YceI
MKISKNILFVTAFVASLVAQANAQTKTFEIDSKTLGYRNVASIESVADFETFTGKTNAVTGSISFDWSTKVGKGKIVVDPSAIDTGIPLRNEHMKGKGWLEVDKYPEIVFEALKVQGGRKDEYKVTGKFTLHGVTKKITVPVTVRYSAAGEATKAAGFNGDVIRLTTKFNITLADYGIIVPAQVSGKIAKEVTIALSTYAIAK